MKNLIKDFTNEFREIKEPIKVISHLDADGLTSAAIISKTLKRNDNEFSLSIVRQLDEDKIRELSLEDYNYFLFVDLGSGFLSLISKHLNDRKIFILDHHVPENFENNFYHVNPHLIGMDSWSISGAGLAYLFSKELNKDNIDMAYISVIGGVGGYINFLNELGIEYKNSNGNFRKLNDLNDEELKELITGVILKRFGSEENPDDVLGNIYLL